MAKKCDKKCKVTQEMKKIDKKQLKTGERVELEHGTVNPATNITNNSKKKTKKIAEAHLLEDPKYYTHLKKMEKKYKKKK
jgi:hypothetical protein